MTTNKEVIEKLVAYYKDFADFDTLARALANCMVDFRRLVCVENLEEQEFECLMARIRKNSENLENFVNNGDTEKFTLKIVSRAEEV